MLTLFVCLAALSCRDALPTDIGNRPPPVAAPKTLATLDCVADVSAREVTCEMPRPEPGSARLDLMLGQLQVKMASTNLLSDTVAQTFAFDATAQNLMGEPIGTPDGVTVTGLKVFFHSGPTVTAYKVPGDTSKVTVANADSTGNFTGANQPYHFYNQLLQPQEVSAKKRWVFNVPRTVDRFSFGVKVLAAAPSETPVPATAPDFMPDWLDADANWLNDTPCFGKAVGNAVIVTFCATATQEERQAAVDFVGGTVVGGMYGGPDGSYIIKIADQPSGEALCSSLKALSALPQVEVANPLLPAAPALYQAPNDGPLFDRWKLDAPRADSANWALEAIAAPQAWGCETGRHDLPIGIVDINHVSAPDVWENATHVDSAHLFPGVPANSHGTRVASVTAAQGNNNRAMTGVMWDADLRLYDYRRHAPDQSSIPMHIRQTRRLVDAARAGAKVINFSFGFTWQEVKGRPPLSKPDSLSQDSALMRVYYTEVRNAVRRVKQSSDALVVIAAGNTPVDAYWAGYPQVQADYPDRVIVVAGSNQASQLWTRDADAGSGRNVTNNLVEVAAPGEAVHSILGGDTLAPANGTSLAAPHVTGLVGLLLSFDPRLTPAEAKRLVLVGAQRGGKMAGGIPVINAYESLKAAAERPGAPLCGNRVWVGNGHVQAQRGDGAGAMIENLFPTTLAMWYLEPFHGGKLMRVYGTGRGLYRWQAGNGWSLWTSPPDSVLNNGFSATERSYGGSSHDGDAFAGLVVTGSSQAVVLYDSLYNAVKTLGAIPGSVHGSASLSKTCIRRTVKSGGRIECPDSASIGTETEVDIRYLAYPPQGDAILVSTSGAQKHYEIARTWYACPAQPDQSALPDTAKALYECQDWRHRGEATGATIYSVSISSGQVTPLANFSGLRLGPLASAEGRMEFVVQATPQSPWSRNYEWTGSNRGDVRIVGDTTDGHGACELQYRTMANPTAVAFRVPTCGRLQATFSPSRRSASATPVISRPSSAFPQRGKGVARRPAPPVATGWRSIFSLARLLPRWSVS